MVNGSRRRGRRRATARAPRIRRAITRATQGSRLFPSPDPPEFTNNPWWPITLPIIIDSPLDLNINTIAEALIDHLGWKNYKDMKSVTAIPLDLRVLSLRAWGLNRQPFTMTVREPFSPANDFVELSDYGSAVNYSRLGYRYGTVSTTNVHESLGSDWVPASFSGGITATSKVLLYVQLLMRSSVANAPKKVTLPALLAGMEIL